MSDLYKFAYYKTNNKPWTQEEVDYLRKSHGQRATSIPNNRLASKYIYAYNLKIDSDLYPWTAQKPRIMPDNYIKIPFDENKHNVEYSNFDSLNKWIDK